MTTVLITGANRGIGLEFVRQYAQDGATVIACCREPDKAAELKAMAKAHPKISVQALEVTDFAAVTALGKELAKEAVDVVINNAGYYGPKRQSADDMDYPDWAYTFAVNTMAPLAVAQAFHAQLKRGHDRKLISITSGLGSTSENGGGYVAYRASKAALNNVMKSLSVDWKKDGIIAVAMDPGWVQTDMGGKSAPLKAGESVGGMRKVIAGLTGGDSGKYLKWNGQEREW
jgi:NAD(P)-dependent dehydrogenase (short-subunit alcohol dehydrogenase family)